MIIDSHEHVIYPTTEQLRLMDEAGVEKTILFSTTPHIEKAKSLPELEKELGYLYAVLSGSLTKEERYQSNVRSTKELCEVVHANPDHFYGFGMVPLGFSYVQTCAWMEEYIVANGLKGIGEFSPAAGQVKLLDVVFQAAKNYNNLPIWIHTFSPITMLDISEIAALCEKYPSVPVIFGHMGGTNWLDTIKLAKSHKNMYLDLSAVFTTIAPKFAIQELPDRTLFSSDAPHGSPELSRKMVELVSPSDKVTEQVLGGNIARLLNL